MEGWVAAFEPEGAMMRNGTPVVGPAAVGEMMKPMLAGGRLHRAPIASGRSGDLGFTVGKGTFTGDKPEDTWNSSYVTIWRRGADGSWKVRFDTGRAVHEESPYDETR
jgi:ketosteroid isomerase-like protein